MKNNIVGWFEIPVAKFDRAVKFYELVFGITMEILDLGDLKMALFPWKENIPGARGALACHEKFYRPSADGVLIYLTSPSGDLDVDLKKAEDAGGKVIFQRRQISEEFGYMGMFIDSEGNRIALHSRK